MNSSQKCLTCLAEFTPKRDGKFCSTKCYDHMQNKAKRAKRKSLGLCQRCGNPSDGKYNCVTCREWYRKYTKGHSRATHLKRRYGLTEEDFNNYLIAQGGSCAICKTTKQKNLHVDHSHATGKVRGLLCATCNMGLGIYEANQKAFEIYLEQSE